MVWTGERSSAIMIPLKKCYDTYMIQILLHSSKTMRTPEAASAPLGTPALLKQASRLVELYRNVSPITLQTIMKVSTNKAAEVEQLLATWTDEPACQAPAIDSFVGDIYSGLQVQSWSEADRRYAHQHLLILSGLYGGLRACDGAMPYRLEMGYKLPNGTSLYTFWGKQLASLLPASTSIIINLSAVEYTKALLPHVDLPVITPKFLTVSPKTGEPTFVTVHTKITRGAFARWLIQHQVQDTADLPKFADLGYHYDKTSSTPEQPVYVCQTFEGLGLSVRLT